MKIDDFYSFKKGNGKISMITCYDWTSAIILSKTPIDAVLVGDSIAMTIYGYNSTIYATAQMMQAHTYAVKKALSDKLVITDMPFMTFRKGKYYAVDVAGEFVKAGADAVKIEGLDGHEDVIEHLVKSGIAVMGHLGITPQYEKTIGRFRKIGKKSDEAKKIEEDAKRLEELGCFSLVLECVDEEVAGRITSMLKIPVIGIGSGSKTDGQIIVFHDILGLYPNPPSFVKIYDNISERIAKAITEYVADVKRE
ncbi:MAG: 3-methyl-2-oxobutanoate hydroxymethyltransferase [Elusimicrobiales bacterium]